MKQSEIFIRLCYQRPFFF